MSYEEIKAKLIEALSKHYPKIDIMLYSDILDNLIIEGIKNKSFDNIYLYFKEIYERYNGFYIDPIKDSGHNTLIDTYPLVFRWELKNYIGALDHKFQRILYETYSLDLDKYYHVDKTRRKELSRAQYALKKLILDDLRRTDENNYHKSLVEIYPEFSYDELKEAISKLNPHQQKVIYKRFGEYYDLYNPLDSEEEQIKLYNSLNRLEEYLLLSRPKKESIRNIPLKDKYKNKSLEELRNLISNLNIYEEDIIYKVYGPNLDRYEKPTKEERKILNSALNKLAKMVVHSSKPNLFEILDGLTKNEILYLITRLHPDYQRVIFNTFTSDLTVYLSCSKESRESLNIALKQLKYMAFNEPLTEASTTISIMYPDIPINILLELISNINPKYSNVLLDIYGKRLNIRNKNTYGNDLYNAKKALDKKVDEYRSYYAPLTKKHILISKLLDGTFSGRAYSLKEIAEHLNMSEKTCLIYAKRVIFEQIKEERKEEKWMNI